MDFEVAMWKVNNIPKSIPFPLLINFSYTSSMQGSFTYGKASGCSIHLTRHHFIGT
jgi:hypothetical protein